MTNRQIIQSLISMGVEVSYYVRKDGSIRVTNLNGEKFSPRLSQGNEAARLLLYKITGEGEKEAAARVAAELKPIRAQRVAAQRTRASGYTLRSQSKQFQAEFKALQRRVKAMAKANIAAGKRGFEPITWAKTKEVASIIGKTPEEQLRRLQDYYEPLAGDIAPRVMVQALIKRIEEIEAKYYFLAEMRVYLENNIAVQDIYALDKAGSVIYDITATEGDEDGQKPLKAANMLEELQEKAHNK